MEINTYIRAVRKLVTYLSRDKYKKGSPRWWALHGVGGTAAQGVSRCLTIPNFALYELTLGGATRASSYILRAGRLKHALSRS